MVVILREIHPLPKVDDTLAQFAGAKVFSKLDANSGFRQIPLAEKSHHLITFLTPFRHFCFNKMPIGIFSAPDHLQKCMNEILSGLPDIAYLINDILVYGSTLAEHDKHLQAILEWIQSAGARSVNSAKPQSNSLVTLSHLKESCLIHQMHCLTHHKNIPFKRYNY